jgi:hypothetical protein
MNISGMHADFHWKLAFLNYTASQIDIGVSPPFNGQSSSKKGTFDENRYSCP